MGGEEGRDESPDSRRLGRKLGREIWGGENPKERSGPLRKRKEKKIGRVTVKVEVKEEWGNGRERLLRSGSWKGEWKSWKGRERRATGTL